MPGGLDSSTSGTIRVNDKDISQLSDNELADYRASTVGFVFQFYNLIPTLTVYENIALVREISDEALDPVKMPMEVGLVFIVHLLTKHCNDRQICRRTEFSISYRLSLY